MRNAHAAYDILVTTAPFAPAASHLPIFPFTHRDPCPRALFKLHDAARTQLTHNFGRALARAVSTAPFHATPWHLSIPISSKFCKHLHLHSLSRHIPPHPFRAFAYLYWRPAHSRLSPRTLDNVMICTPRHSSLHPPKLSRPPLAHSFIVEHRRSHPSTHSAASFTHVLSPLSLNL